MTMLPLFDETFLRAQWDVEFPLQGHTPGEIAMVEALWNPV